jgi:hypothetical protein
MDDYSSPTVPTVGMDGYSSPTVPTVGMDDSPTIKELDFFNLLPSGDDNQLTSHGRSASVPPYLSQPVTRPSYHYWTPSASPVYHSSDFIIDMDQVMDTSPPQEPEQHHVTTTTTTSSTSYSTDTTSTGHSSTNYSSTSYSSDTTTSGDITSGDSDTATSISDGYFVKKSEATLRSRVTQPSSSTNHVLPLYVKPTPANNLNSQLEKKSGRSLQNTVIVVVLLLVALYGVNYIFSGSTILKYIL